MRQRTIPLIERIHGLNSQTPSGLKLGRTRVTHRATIKKTCFFTFYLKNFQMYVEVATWKNFRVTITVLKREIVVQIYRYGCNSRVRIEIEFAEESLDVTSENLTKCLRPWSQGTDMDIDNFFKFSFGDKFKKYHIAIIQKSFS